MSTLTERILEIVKANAISVHHFKLLEEGCVIQCKTPGYMQVLQFQKDIEQKMHLKTKLVFSDSIPHVPQVQPVQFANIIKSSDVYKSQLTSYDQITPQSVQQAYESLKKFKAIDDSTVLRDTYYSNKLGAEIYLQYENLQQTGSFKIRGGSNMLMKMREQFQQQNKEIPGVVACSAGNHAQGVAKTADLLGINCTIVCPESAPQTKLYNTMRYNAEVIKQGKAFDEAQTFAIKLAEQRGWTLVPPFNDFDVMEGQATIALELCKKVQPDAVLINVGGGGLISGMALYIKKMFPKCKVIGVQAERVFPLKNFIQSGKLEFVEPAMGTIADGCNVKVPGGLHDEVLKKYVDQYISVPENEIAATIVNVLLQTKTLTEGGGCMGVTALLYKRFKVQRGEKIAVLLCGGNIDIVKLQGIMKLGQIGLGRRLKAQVPMGNASGSLLALMQLIQKYNGIVDYIRHEKDVQEIDWDAASVTIEVKLPCLEAVQKLKEILTKTYPKIQYLSDNLVINE